MRYCFHCGKELPEGSGFCPYCGKLLQQEPEKPRASGGAIGKSVASIVLGGESLVCCFGSLAMLFYQFVIFLFFSASEGTEEATIFSGILYAYIFFVSMMAVSFSVAAKILAGKVLAERSGYRPASIGNKLSTIGLVLSIAALVMGLFPMLAALI